MNATKFFLTKLMGILMCCLSVFSNVLSTGILFVEDEKYEQTYSDDVSSNYDEYDGTGTQVSTDYDVEYSRVEIELNTIISAPSYSADGATYSNFCAPLTGTNIIVYYDRWCTNLVQDFEPGMFFANGSYHYYPDLYYSATESAFDTLYTLMKTNTTPAGGTTSANFKSGLNSYVQDAGYNISYSSLYGTSSCVNMNSMENAVAQNKVGLLMCSQYNFVYSITNNESQKKVHVSKTSSTAGHMMMVYGIKKYRYYNASNVNFRTDTFLLASSGYSSGDQGYILMDNDLTIVEAYIVSIA